MPTLTFYNLGNADACRIDLDSGEKLLFDFGHQRNPDDAADLRCDLSRLLRKDLKKAGRDFLDVVAISHLDKDHYQGATEFFHLLHAKKYQTEGRIKINTLWVPAAVITEEGVDDSEGKAIRAEARYRLLQGKGIRVFSRPERLRKWLEANKVRLEDRQHLITDAGQLVPGFMAAQQGLEIFVHCPFARRLNENEVEDRNGDCLVLHLTFTCDTTQTKVIFAGDVTQDVLSEIVGITRSKKNQSRLEWDVVKLPHHCSYLSLGPDRGEDETKPVADVACLYQDRGQKGGILISSSKPIPEKGSEADEGTDPPHRQAAAYYRRIADGIDGEFVVTMEHPKKSAPEPLIIAIGTKKAMVQKSQLAGVASVLSQPAPRAGRG